MVYGVTTGFGKFARTVIPKKDLEYVLSTYIIIGNVTIKISFFRDLQLNLIRSHAAGVGDCLPLHRIRMMLALRINVLAKGYSGISLDNLNKMIDIFNG